MERCGLEIGQTTGEMTLAFGFETISSNDQEFIYFIQWDHNWYSWQIIWQRQYKSRWYIVVVSRKGWCWWPSDMEAAPPVTFLPSLHCSTPTSSNDRSLPAFSPPQSSFIPQINTSTGSFYIVIISSLVHQSFWYLFSSSLDTRVSRFYTSAHFTRPIPQPSYIVINS